MLSEHEEDMWQNVKDCLSQKELLEEELRQWPQIEVFPTAGNFTCFRFEKAAWLVAELEKNYRILIRNFSEDLLRVSISSKDHNTMFLRAMKELLSL